MKKALLIFLVGLSSCNDPFVLVHHYDPDQVSPGDTMTGLYSSRQFLLFNFLGDILWQTYDLKADAIFDFEILDDTNILYIAAGGVPAILEYPGNPIYSAPVRGAHHSVSMLPWGNLLYLRSESIDVGGWMGTIGSDCIDELDPDTGEIVWEWKSHEHIDPLTHYCPICINTLWGGKRDWTHGNTAQYYEHLEAILYNPRNLDTVYLISYPQGEILWACGKYGSFGQGLFSHPHDPCLLPNGNLLMFDNGNHREPHQWSRALELGIDPANEEAWVVWEYRENPDFFSASMSDANRLPNGNTLITDAWQGRILEVNPQAQKVWEVTIVNQAVLMAPYMMYKAERIPENLWRQ